MGSSKSISGVIANSATESGTSSRTHSDTDVDNHSSSSPYAQGEKVLAYHNTRIYAAKVLTNQSSISSILSPCISV